MKIINNTDSKYINTIFYIAILIIIVTYFVNISSYAVNFPCGDEYDAALNTLDSFVESDFPDNFLLLFHQHNEHRMASYYILAVAQYFLFGELNFTWQLIFANLFMIGLFYLIYRLNPILKKQPLLLLIAASMLFIPMNAISNWPVMAMNGIFQYFLVFASLALLDKLGRYNFIFAMLLAAFATFSFGNGMFAFLLGYIFILSDEKISKKKVLVWTICTVVCIGLYFINYKPVIGHPSKLLALQNPITVLEFFIMFFSNPFKEIADKSIIMYFLAGAGVLTTFLFALWKNRKIILKKRLALSYMLFVLISAGVAAVSRFLFGLHTAISGRYMLLPLLFVIVLYSFMLKENSKPSKTSVFFLLLFSTILFTMNTRAGLHNFALYKNRLLSGMVSYYFQDEPKRYSYPNQEYAHKSLQKSIEKNYFKILPISEIFGNKLIKNVHQPVVSGNIRFCIDEFINDSTLIFMKGWAFSEKAISGNSEIVVYFQNESDKQFYSTAIDRRMDVIQTFYGKYAKIEKDCGFYFAMDKSKIKINGENNQVGVGILNNGKIIASALTDYYYD